MEMDRAMSQNAHGTCVGYMRAIRGTDMEDI